jgi:hypothetical protein
VRVLDADEWRYPLHRHTHYELIYILHGTGTPSQRAALSLPSR